MVRAEPLQPFAVNFAAGRSFTVRHPESLSCSVNGQEMVVHDDHGTHFIEMLIVEVIEPVQPPSNERKRKRA